MQEKLGNNRREIIEEYGIMELLELAKIRCGWWTGNKYYLEWPYVSTCCFKLRCNEVITAA